MKPISSMSLSNRRTLARPGNGIIAVCLILLLLGGCKAEEEDSAALALAALALSNVDTNCGTIDLGNTERAPTNLPSTGSSPVQFSISSDGTKYLAAVILENMPAGAVFVIGTGSIAGAFAFGDSTCPIDQGTNNADTLANSVILRTANSAATTFTVQTAGSYAIVVTAVSDPGESVTMKRN